jgi:hypothetical protein
VLQPDAQQFSHSETKRWKSKAVYPALHLFYKGEE